MSLAGGPRDVKTVSARRARARGPQSSPWRGDGPRVVQAIKARVRMHAAVDAHNIVQGESSSSSNNGEPVDVVSRTARTDG